MRYILLLSLICLVAACTPPEEPVACTLDAKQCSDGTYVSRVGPDCEFAECPSSQGEACTEEAKLCGDGTYVARMPPDCEFAECPEEKIIACTPEQRNADACIEIYQPVCGWFDDSVQCIKYPCATTYGNSCLACLAKEVAYYTEGLCPQ